VLDLDLPGKASLMVLRELRHDFRLASLPVVVMAWSDDQPSMRTLYGLGVVGYFVKPLCFSDLLTLVSNICQMPNVASQESSSGNRSVGEGAQYNDMTMLLLIFRQS